MKWQAVETYAPDNPTSDKRRQTVEFELLTTEAAYIAKHAYVLLHGGTTEEAAKEMDDLDDQIDGVDLTEDDGFDITWVDGEGETTLAISKVAEGARKRTVKVKLTYRLDSDKSVEELEMFYGQQIEVTLREAGLAEGLVGVETECQ